MMLNDKLHNTMMSKGTTVTSYLSRLTQVRDKMAIFGEIIVDDELVQISLNGFLKHCEVFVKCV